REDGRVEGLEVGAAVAQVDLEDLAALLLGGDVEEEDLVEAALADDLGGEQVDAVRGRGHEHGRRLLLPPGEEGREDAPGRARAASGRRPGRPRRGTASCASPASP